MNAGVLAQMASTANSSNNGLASPLPGFASRRGGQTIKPLTFDSSLPPAENENNMLRTPRTSRSHLLQGLRTAPKTATAATFPVSPSVHVGAPTTPGYPSGTLTSMQNAQNHLRPQTPLGAHSSQASLSVYHNAPKSALPTFTSQAFIPASSGSAQYTVDQVLAPPGIPLDDRSRESMDPSVYAQMLATNIYLAQQRQHLQQQLLNIQAAAQHFQGLGLSPVTQPQHIQQQPFSMMSPSMMSQFQHQQQQQQQQVSQHFQQHQLQFQIQQQLQQQQQKQQQQQQLRLQLQLQQHSQQQQQFNNMHQAHFAATSPNPYAYLDSAASQSAYIVDQGLQAHMAVQAAQSYIGSLCPLNTPLVQVLPPSESPQPQFQYLAGSLTPKRYGSPVDSASIPTQSVNSFRRAHKKVTSLANLTSPLTTPIGDAPRSAGPKLAMFSPSPLHGGYGPGQARAGEHPIRQPRGPPSLDELVSKPTSKYEGSKNFSARARRYAVHNLVRAGIVRRKGTGSSSGSASRSGSISILSEGGEDASTPVTDNESDSQSCADSLVGETDCSRLEFKATVNSAWGAIGSDRPSSRQKSRQTADNSSGLCSPDAEGGSSFADVFKNSSLLAATKTDDALDVRRKAPMLVLTNSDKRRLN